MEKSPGRSRKIIVHFSVPK